MMNSLGNNVFFGAGPFVGMGAFAVLGGILMLALVIALIALKGYALWYAAKRDERWWFVVMLVINTAGLLELVYLIFVVHRWHTRITEKNGPHTHTHTHENHHG